MKFFASIACDSEPLVLASAVIEAESWHDAHQYARKIFGPLDVSRPGHSTVRVTQTGEDAEADIEIRWEGTDYGAYPDRHREVRTRRNGEWSEWTRE